MIQTPSASAADVAAPQRSTTVVQSPATGSQAGAQKVSVPGLGAALLVTLSDSTQAELADAKAKADDAISSMDQARKGLIADRKAAAEQKLELARKKLAMLRMMGGDPKTVARQAKLIAKEIGDAAKEYGAALKAEGGGSGLEAPAGASAEATGDDATKPASDASTAPETSPDAASGSGAAVLAAGVVQPGTAKPETPADAVPKPDPDASRQKAIEAYQETAANASKGQAEQQTLQNFKDAAREARQLIEAAAAKLKSKHGSNADAKDAEHAAKDIDKEVQALGQAIEDPSGGVAAVAGDGGVTGTTATAINILL